MLMRVPFVQEELFEQILCGEIMFPSPYWDHVGHLPRHLIEVGDDCCRAPATYAVISARDGVVG